MSTYNTPATFINDKGPGFLEPVEVQSSNNAHLVVFLHLGMFGRKYWPTVEYYQICTP